MYGRVQIIRLDGMTKVGDPVKKFEKEHKIFPQGECTPLSELLILACDELPS